MKIFKCRCRLRGLCSSCGPGMIEHTATGRALKAAENLLSKNMRACINLYLYGFKNLSDVLNYSTILIAVFNAS